MKSKEVKKVLGITQPTLNSYINKGLIRYVVINPYHYDYNESDVYALIGRKKTKNFTYSRVSLPKQKDDLTSQTKRLLDFSISNGIIIHEQIEDIKSGMSFSNRKGFTKLLESIMTGEVGKVVIENKDRFARFGFELLEEVCRKYGTEIIVASEVEDKTYEQELVEDLISIIHHFSMKSYSNRAKLNRIKKQLEEK